MEYHIIVRCTNSARGLYPNPGDVARRQMKVFMRIFSLAVAVILAVAASVPASAEDTPTGSPKVASLRCVQFAMVREHHHSPAGWPTDCGSQMRSQPKKG
jgi:hypothetical protein